MEVGTRVKVFRNPFRYSTRLSQETPDPTEFLVYRLLPYPPSTSPGCPSKLCLGEGVYYTKRKDIHPPGPVKNRYRNWVDYPLRGRGRTERVRWVVPEGPLREVKVQCRLDVDVRGTGVPPEAVHGVPGEVPGGPDDREGPGGGVTDPGVGRGPTTHPPGRNPSRTRPTRPSRPRSSSTGATTGPVRCTVTP